MKYSRIFSPSFYFFSLNLLVHFDQQRIMNQDDLYVYNLQEKVTKEFELLYFDSKTLETIEVDDSITTESSKKTSTSNVHDIDYYKSDLYRYNLKDNLEICLLFLKKNLTNYSKKNPLKVYQDQTTMKMKMRVIRKKINFKV